MNVAQSVFSLAELNNLAMQPDFEHRDGPTHARPNGARAEQAILIEEQDGVCAGGRGPDGVRVCTQHNAATRSAGTPTH